MKTLFAAGAVLMALAMPAFAADMPARITKAPIAPPPPALYNWSGFYSATGLGGAWSQIDGDFVNFPNDHHNTRPTRFNLATMLGLQYQFGQVVLGVEGGFNKLYKTDFDNNQSISGDCLGGSFVADRTCSSRINNIWTVGPRLGYAWDRLMIYGTGGYANGHIYTRTTVTSTGALTSATDGRHNGWFAGAGFEYYVTKLWLSDLILGAEYQHIDLRAGRENDGAGIAALGLNDRNMQASIDVVRARIVFKYSPDLFGGGGAVAARY